MTIRKFKVLKCLVRLASVFSRAGMTVGEISRATNIPYSSVRRALMNMVDNGLVEYRCDDYKAGFARYFSPTKAGVIVFRSQKELWS